MASDATAMLITFAKAVQILSSALFTGITIGYSFLLIPAILKSPPPLMLQQWRAPFLAGKRVMPPLFLSCAISSFYLALQCRAGVGELLMMEYWKNYVLCGVLGFSIMPYTIILVEPTNWKLLAMEEKVGKKGKEEDVDGEEAVRLVKRWKSLNDVRILIMGTAMLAGCYTSLR